MAQDFNQSWRMLATLTRIAIPGIKNPFKEGSSVNCGNAK
jgi:hypothetical protein